MKAISDGKEFNCRILKLTVLEYQVFIGFLVFKHTSKYRFGRLESNSAR
jgi:hypothetical protein